MASDEFERRLRQDLPRGHVAQPKSAGRERGLFARWLTPEEMTGEQWSHEGGLLLGRRAGCLIGWKDDRHVMTIAGSRAGKGVSLIIPNLFRYEGSALVVDPKGENAAETAAWREEGLGQDVHVLDPFSVSGRPCSSFNPLAELDAEYPHLIEDAGLFADALITHPDRGEKHWTESAQALLRALILLVAGEDETRRNLITVRKLLMLSDEKIRDRQFAAAQKGQELSGQEALIQLLRAEINRSHGHICVGLAEQLSAMGDNERGSVLSSARTQTQWLDDERIADVLCRSDFDVADLKRRKTTIYLCLPAMRMGTHARWFRLMILLALSVMERISV
jgi:type IV secretion system protein VirD4